MSDEAIVAAGVFTGFCAGFAHGYFIKKFGCKYAGIAAVGAIPVFAFAPQYFGAYAGGLLSAAAGRLLGGMMRKEKPDLKNEEKKLYDLASVSVDAHDEYVMGTLLSKLKNLNDEDIKRWNNLLNLTRYFGRVRESLDEVLESAEPISAKIYLQDNDETDGALYVVEQDVVTRDDLSVPNARITEQDGVPVKTVELVTQVRRAFEFALDRYSLADLIHKEKGITVLIGGNGPYDMKHYAGVQAYAQLAVSRMCGDGEKRDAA